MTGACFGPRTLPDGHQLPVPSSDPRTFQDSEEKREGSKEVIDGAPQKIFPITSTHSLWCRIIELLAQVARFLGTTTATLS